VDRIAKMVGISPRWVRKNISELEASGFLRVTRRDGMPSDYELMVNGSQVSWNLGTQFTPELSSPLNSVPQTPEFCDTEPLNSVHPNKTIRNKTKEEELTNILSPQEKKKKKKELPDLTKEELEEQFRTIEGNLNLYIEAFPNRNVRETLDALKERVYEGDGKKEGLNVDGYRNLHRTFRNWLRNAKYVPSWVAAQANTSPTPLPDKLPEAKVYKPYIPSQDPELMESLTNIAEKRQAKMEARKTEAQKEEERKAYEERKARVMEELKRDVEEKEKKKEEQGTEIFKSIPEPKPLTTKNMTKEQIKAAMERIVNG
jgi:DNA-binding Lrp family transcriptional regulator